MVYVLNKVMVLWILFFYVKSAFATGAGLTYHGRIIDPNGNPVNGSAVQFKIQIRTPGNEDCLLYEESQIKDMSNADGVFSITINDGSGSRLDSSGYAIDQIFANRGTFTFAGGKCAIGTTYSPNSSDGRRIQLFFNDGTLASGTWEPNTPMPINFVPMAIETLQIGGYKKEQLIKLADGVSTTGSELDSTKWTNLLALLNGTSTQYLSQSSSSSISLPSYTTSAPPTTPAAGSIWFDSTSKEIKYNDGTTTKTVGASTTGTIGIANGGTGTTTQAGAANAILPSQASNSGKFLTTDGTNASWSTAGASQWTTTGSDIFYNTGNVGVGTNTPSSQLDVYSTDTTSSSKTMGNFYLWASPSSSSAGATKTGIISKVEMNSNYSMGNLKGISSTVNDWGISSPQTLTSMIGVDSYLSQTNSGNVTDMKGFNTELFVSDSPVITNVYGLDALLNFTSFSTATNAYGIRSRVSLAGTGTTSSAYGGYFDVNKGGSTSITNSYGVYVGTIAGTNKWSMYTSDSTAPSYFAGKVGIGTSTPTVELDVVGNSQFTSGKLGVGSTASATYTAKFQVTRETNNSSNAVFGIGGQGISIMDSWPAIVFNGVWEAGGIKNMGTGYSGRWSMNPSTGDVTWWKTYKASNPSGSVGGTSLDTDVQNFTITGSGNVGIGTTTPAYKLSLSNSIASTSGLVSNFSNQTTFTPSAASSATVKGIDNSLTLTGSQSTVGGTIIGVDTTVSKTSLATIGKAIGTKTTVNHSSGAAGDITVVDSILTNSQTINFDAKAISGVINNSGTISTYAYGGYFGINNSSVIGTGYGVYIDNVSATTPYSLYSIASAPSYFAGNVGIGTTTPQDKLDINGNIRVAKNSAQPYACDAAHDAVIALTSQYTTCVCKGGSTTWVRTSDGTTACSW